jgi:peroxiredoxin
MSQDFSTLPADLPVPEDDGAADHLPGMPLPDVALPSSQGGNLNLAQVGGERVVVYIYPRTGKPGEPLPEGWDDIPGARGCTVQSCAFRDHASDLAAHGAALIGISAQSPEDQREFAEREHIPYPVLSDDALQLAELLGLPTFETSGMRLYKRLTFIAREGRIEKVFYPIFPPGRDAVDVLSWLQEQAAA